ncbi:MAG: hypothetical protein KIS72_06830, partial [Luteimonas sp.]|nr:hypothetical protein [Luteimonas sp.]
EFMRDGERDAFVATSAQLAPLRPLAIRIASLPAGASEAGLRAVVGQALTRSTLTVSATNNGSAPVLAMTFERPAQPAGGRAVWQMALMDGDRRLFESTYASFLPRETNERTLNAFAEAAVLSVIPKLREALTPAPGSAAR